MFLWRSLDPRTLTSVLGWMAERERRKAEAARAASSPSRPAPVERPAPPEGARARRDAERR
ncbi:MAG TPA: hypothetical protein VMV26_05665 [Alphaproteobacteria bacterium]|jgi:hypothetical protein|nr:hypothetical protein [Alphaproteobacteria bacterium]